MSGMRTYVTYGALFAIVVMVGALVGWYFVLRSEQQGITAADVARGDASSVFEGAIGSTYANIVGMLTGKGTEGGVEQRPPRMWQVSKTPVAGMTFMKDGNVVRVQFVERATGYVLSASTETGEVTRVTNTLKPRVYEALFTKDGGVILRSLEGERIKTFAGSTIQGASGTTTSSSESALEGVYLDDDILELTADPDAPAIFSLLPSGNGGIVGAVSGWDGGKAKRIFDSSVTGWESTWLPDGRIILAQKAADDVPGYAYALSSTGVLTPLIRGVPGLTILAKSSSDALLFGRSAGIVSLFARVSQNATAVTLPVKTPADKCVWSPGASLVAFCAVPQSIPSGNYLNERYAGTAHTSDAWWRINASAGTAELLYAPDGATLDVEQPVVDDSGTYIAFLNGVDRSLWVLRIPAE
jgi:hypothetical protein